MPGVRLCQIVHEAADCGQLGFDAFGELKLHGGSAEVVALVLGMKVDVTLKVIGQKAQTQLEGDQTNAVRQIVQIPVTEKPRATLRYPVRIASQRERSKWASSGLSASSPAGLQQERRQSPMS